MSTTSTLTIFYTMGRCHLFNGQVMPLQSTVKNVLAFCICFNKLSQPSWLKITGIFFSQFQRPDFGKVHANIYKSTLTRPCFLQRLWQSVCSSTLLSLGATGVPRLTSACGHIVPSLPLLWHHLLLLCVYQISLCFSLMRTFVTGYRDHQENPEKKSYRNH